MKNHKLRWWPAAIIVFLDLLFVGWIWLFWDTDRQLKVLTALSSQIVALLLLGIWLIFFSRLRLKMRINLAVGAMAILVLFFFLFPFKEFTGDLVPTFAWRWTSKSLSSGNLNVAGNSDLNDPLQSSNAGYPQFLGPNRNGKVVGIKLDSDWQVRPPKQLWRKSIGKGWSAFAVAGNFAVTHEQQGNKEMVVCYDLKSGKILWQSGDSARFDSNAFFGGIGPRATPTIDEGRVYTVGATGILNCLTLKNGKPVWQKNILEDNNSQSAEWGVAGSPLVFDSLTVVSAGGTNGRSLVAYHKQTGRLIWAAGNEQTGYSSPLVTEIAGIGQILIFNQGGIIAHMPKTGEILWKFLWPGRNERVAQPVVLPNDRVFASMGYSVGSILIEISRAEDGSLSPTLLWESRRMKAKFTNVIAVGEFIYGLDDGILACIDLKEGKRQWKRGRYGHGQMILVENMLLITTEKGDVVLVEPDPKEHKEVARFSAIQGKTWNNPALAGPYLLVRNSQEAACYELPLLE